MNKRSVFVGIAALLFLIVVVGSILATSWSAGSLGTTNNNQFSGAIFNDFGLAVLVVGVVLFVSMLGGVYIAQEEQE